MVEYALMVLLVAVALILTVTALKDGIAKPLGEATAELTDKSDPAIVFLKSDKVVRVAVA